MGSIVNQSPLKSMRVFPLTDFEYELLSQRANLDALNLQAYICLF